jgi:hypothetical protein
LADQLLDGGHAKNRLLSFVGITGTDFHPAEATQKVARSERYSLWGSLRGRQPPQRRDGSDGLGCRVAPEVSVVGRLFGVGLFGRLVPRLVG